MKYFLALDAGTTSVKGVLFDSDGRACAVELVEYDLARPKPDIVELDPEVYWHAARKVIRGLLAESRAKASEILSVGITSQGETLIAVDGNGRPLRPAIVWLDNRSQREAEEIAREFNVENVFRITGQHEVVPTWTATRILWLRRNEPSVFRNAGKFLLVEDYLLHRLTGRYVTDCALNPSTLYFDITRNEWWPDMLRFLRISREQLPELAVSGKAVFPLSPAAAMETGLSGETAVTTAPIDQVAGAIGAGNIEPGVVSEATGGALAVCATFDKPVYDPQRRAPCQTHGVEGKYLLLAWAPTAGMAFRWFRDEFGGGREYADLVNEAAAVSPGADGLVFLPYLCGAGCPDTDPSARGVFWGIALGHRRAHFVRAVMESVAFVLKRNVDYVETIGGKVVEIRSLGGGARSDLWLQIKADMLNRKLLVMECEESSCTGVAMLSAVACGVYGDLAQARDRMVRVRKEILPDGGAARSYEDVVRRYSAADRDLRELRRAAP